MTTEEYNGIVTRFFEALEYLFQSTHPHGVRLYILQILDIQQSHYRYLRNTNNIRIINRN